MKPVKNIYFISDIHLGFPDPKESMEREKLLVQWLDEVAENASEIYFLGDVFDFWFEYKRVVPRGFTRFLGKLAELTDRGIPVHFFTGNHDIWVFDYLPAETGVILHKDKLITEFSGKKFLLAHGDGLGPYDKGFKRMKKVFTNPFWQWCFARLHPNFGVKIAHSMSHKSRCKLHPSELQFKGPDKEWLILYAKRKLEQNHYDYFIFGHRHIPVKFKIQETSTFINLGDWLQNFTYGIFDGEKFELIRYYPEKIVIPYTQA